MPFVRITLKKGKQSGFKKHISESIHNALVCVFEIPEDDLFQVIEELDVDNIIYPKRYMGIPHSSNIIYITIIAKAGRSVAFKKKLYKTIAKNIENSTGHSANDVFITVVENAEENWSFGNGEAQLVNNV